MKWLFPQELELEFHVSSLVRANKDSRQEVDRCEAEVKSYQAVIQQLTAQLTKSQSRYVSVVYNMLLHSLMD